MDKFLKYFLIKSVTMFGLGNVAGKIAGTAGSFITSLCLLLAFFLLNPRGLNYFLEGNFREFLLQKIPYCNILWFSVGVLFVALVLYFLGVEAIKLYEMEYNKHDSKEVIIDEFVGSLIALLISLIISFTFANFFSRSNIMVFLGCILLSFIFFRVFDIMKPGYIGRIDSLKTPVSVMLDDIVAGVCSGISCGICMVIFSLYAYYFI